MNRTVKAVTLVLAFAGLAAAQESMKVEVGPGAHPAEQNRMFVTTGPGMKMMTQSWERLPEGKISFFSADFSGMGEAVKDAPYSATATTESTQTLSDGTHIVNKSSEFIARDSQGRTRHEQTFGNIGALNMEPKKVVFISDPTAHTDYVLSPDEQRARVVKRESMNIFIESGSGTKKKQDTGLAIKLRQARENRANGAEETKHLKHEDLGTQTIEGVVAEGARDTVTIDAGEMGNDRPIQIISEHWYSQDLHCMVLQKHSDPRFGETVVRLTEIKRGEPDPSLFQIPSGFKTSTTTEPTLRELPRRELPKD
jgi:hypothetical protein